MRRIALVAGLLATLTLTAADAPAVDDTKPVACNGLTFKDPSSDQANTQVPADQMTPATEMTGGFIKYDASKGAEATTYNLIVKDLTRTVPSGWTSVSWNAYFTTPDGTIRFVRTLVDFAGGETHEYGSFTPNPTGVGLTGVSQLEGDTQGKLFEGPDGVVQLVIPAEFAPAGTKLETLYASSGQGRTLPGSVDSPSRGLSSVMDTAPDDGADAGVSTTVAPCEGAEPGPTPTPTPGGGGTPPPGSGNSELPVTLVTKAVKAKKAKKRLKLKLRSSEKVTNLGAQLRKGTKVAGTGKLAALDGTGTLTLKLKKRLKKGKYVLDLAGNDAAGKRLLAGARLKVK